MVDRLSFDIMGKSYKLHVIDGSFLTAVDAIELTGQS